MTPEQLFLDHLRHIEKVVAQTCRRCRFRKEEAEDFSSVVKIKLMENDYAILRQFQGSCEFCYYLTVCIKHMMQDYQNHLWGKWRSSAEALRLGEVAIDLENLLRRDGFSFDEAVAILRINRKVEMSELELADLAARLPPRTPRRMEGEEGLLNLPAPDNRADAGIRRQEKTAIRIRAFEALREALQTIPAEDRLIFKMRGHSFTVAQISRKLGLDQKQLYRRIKKAQAHLRHELERQGIHKEDIRDLFDDDEDDDE
jgi:RNA polymerase sigma factor for flagellar operon FliA